MSILKNCLSLQTTKLSYKCRTSYYSNNSLCLHFPFVLSLSKHIREMSLESNRPTVHAEPVEAHSCNERGNQPAHRSC